MPLGQAKCPSSHFWPWVTSRGSNTADGQVFIRGRRKSFPENKAGLGSGRVCAICTFVRALTLAVGLVGVVAAVVGAVADPRRVDAQRGGVAADEILLLHPQHEEVRAVAVVWEQTNTQPQLSKKWKFSLGDERQTEASDWPQAAQGRESVYIFILYFGGLTAAFLIRGVGAVDDLVAPG